MKYFGFAIADSMFDDDALVKRRPLTAADVRYLLDFGDVEPALNPSHQPTIDAARRRFWFAIDVPAKAPKVSLKSGDSIIVMSVRGLPRLEGRHEYGFLLVRRVDRHVANKPSP